MTIRELYEMAVKRGAEDYDMMIDYSDNYSDNYCNDLNETDITFNGDTKTASVVIFTCY